MTKKATYGVITVLVILGLIYFGFTKNVPGIGPYRVQAAFQSSTNIAPNSPVRVAGVDVGKVKSIKSVTRDGEGIEQAIVVMEIKKSALPIKKDATLKIRPRLFLEGNFFVELEPGTPSADELEDGGMIPVNQTAHAVQIDQLFGVLKSDVRTDLKSVLRELGTALVDEGGAAGFNDSLGPSEDAFRSTSQVNEALLGQKPRDLSNLVSNTQKVVSALGSDKEALKGLVTNLNGVAGALNAESASLQAAIRELPDTLDAADPAFSSLNAAFPQLRGFSRDLIPAARNTPAMVRASLPFLDQANRLLSQRELAGLTDDLDAAIPDLARFSRRQVPFLEQGRQLASCTNQVLQPWGDDTVPDDMFPSPGKVHEEFGWGLAGLNGEGRSGDANGQYFRVQGGGGLATVQAGDQFGQALLPIQGTNPPKNSSARTVFRGDVPCETQEPPDLRSGGPGGAPQQSGPGGSPITDLLPIDLPFTPNIPGLNVGGGGGTTPLTDPTSVLARSSAGKDGKLTKAERDAVVKEVSKTAALLQRDSLNVQTLRGRGQGKAAEDMERKLKLTERRKEFLKDDQPRLLEALKGLGEPGLRRRLEKRNSDQLEAIEEQLKERKR